MTGPIGTADRGCRRPHSWPHTWPILRRLLWVVCIGSSVGSVAVGIVGCAGTPPSPPIRIGSRLPPIELTDLQGSLVSSSDWTGTPTVINFWATWCVPCRKEIPVLQELAEEGSVRIVGIALDENREQLVRDYVERAGMTYPLLFGNQAVFESWDGLTIPYTLVLDRDGLLHRVYRGPVTYEDLMRDLEELSADESP